MSTRLLTIAFASVFWACGASSSNDDVPDGSASTGPAGATDAGHSGNDRADDAASPTGPVDGGGGGDASTNDATTGVDAGPGTIHRSVAAIAADVWQTLAVTTDGSVVAWGCGSAGINAGQCAVPPGITNAIGVAAGSYHSAALTSDGNVIAWGCKGSDNGTLHDAGQCATPPAGKYVDLAATNTKTLALRDDGTVVQLGPGSPPPTLNHVAAVAAGTFHNLALKDDGSVVVWGCYDPTQPHCVVPTGLSNVVSIAAADNASFALKSDGTVVAWGCGGDLASPSSPTGSLCIVPPNLNHVIAISAHEGAAFALKDDGSAVLWYRNNEGFLNPPATAVGLKAIISGDENGFAVKQDGSLITWGVCLYDNCTPPTTLTIK